jgi:hypothetical protein
LYEYQDPTAVAKKPRTPKTMPTIELVSSPFLLLLLPLEVLEGGFEVVEVSGPPVLDPGLASSGMVDDTGDADDVVCVVG